MDDLKTETVNSIFDDVDVSDDDEVDGQAVFPCGRLVRNLDPSRFEDVKAHNLILGGFVNFCMLHKDEVESGMAWFMVVGRTRSAEQTIMRVVGTFSSPCANNAFQITRANFTTPSDSTCADLTFPTTVMFRRGKNRVASSFPQVTSLDISTVRWHFLGSSARSLALGHLVRLLD